MDVEWLKTQKRSLGITDADLAPAMGVERSVANKVANGKVALNARRADAVAKLLQVTRDEVLFRFGIAEERPIAHPDLPPTRSADAGDTATVMRMDLSYALGPGTNVDEHYIEAEPVELDISFLRRLTPSSPDMLRIVDGVGDSMTPTIHDSDWLILDLGQRVLNLEDRIWAMSLFGAGAVKRLQTIGKGRVLVISDNPDVPNKEVDTSDIVLVGRIVGSIRRH
jgi:phage repressor protein C with HTH and peptisase S24 domain